MSIGHSFRTSGVMRLLARLPHRAKSKGKEKSMERRAWRGRIEFQEKELLAINEICGQEMLRQVGRNEVNPALTNAITKITRCLGNRPPEGHA